MNLLGKTEIEIISYILEYALALKAEKDKEEAKKIPSFVMSEEDACKNFEFLYRAFKHFLRTQKDFVWGEALIAHENVEQRLFDYSWEVLKSDKAIMPADYYFEYKGKKFTLDVSLFLEEYDLYTEDYILDENILFINVGYYEDTYTELNKKFETLFSYDIKKRKCIQVLDITQVELDALKSRFISTTDDQEILSRVVSRRSRNSQKAIDDN